MTQSLHGQSRQPGFDSTAPRGPGPNGDRHEKTRNGETQTRTGDTTIFSRVLYQLSYLAASPDATDSSVQARDPARLRTQPPTPARYAAAAPLWSQASR
jgi:hypothetical protein